jgi:hypothetical protein
MHFARGSWHLENKQDTIEAESDAIAGMGLVIIARESPTAATEDLKTLSKFWRKCFFFSFVGASGCRLANTRVKEGDALFDAGPPTTRCCDGTKAFVATAPKAIESTGKSFMVRLQSKRLYPSLFLKLSTILRSFSCWTLSFRGDDV